MLFPGNPFSLARLHISVNRVPDPVPLICKSAQISLRPRPTTRSILILFLNEMEEAAGGSNTRSDRSKLRLADELLQTRRQVQILKGAE